MCAQVQKNAVFEEDQRQEVEQNGDRQYASFMAASYHNKRRKIVKYYRGEQ